MTDRTSLGPADAVFALVFCQAPQMIDIRVAPHGAISRVAAVLQDHDVSWSPMLLDDDGVPGALLVYEREGHAPGTVGRLADLLAASGVHAWGFQLSHHHGDPDANDAVDLLGAEVVDGLVTDVDVFIREGEDWPRGHDGPLWIRTYAFGDDHVGLWMFGPQADLLNCRDLLDRVLESCEVRIVDDSHGIAAIEVSLHGDRAASVARRLVARIEREGFVTHVHAGPVSRDH